MNEVKLHISKDTPAPGGAVAVKKVPVKQKLMKKLFGTTSDLTVIAIGASVEKVTIENAKKGNHEYGKETR